MEAVEPLYAYNAKFADAFSPTGKDSNRETIFALRYKLGEKSNHYINFTYNVATFTKYLDKDGNKIGNVFNIGSGAMRYEYSQACYDAFDEDDSRRDATFMQFYLKDNDEKVYPAGRALCKFLGEVDNGKKQFTNDVPVYRYMDVALMLAEVNTCLNVPAEVKKWIEAVRTRAYGAAKRPAFTYTTPEAAEEAILAERTRGVRGRRQAVVRRTPHAGRQVCSGAGARQRAETRVADRRGRPLEGQQGETERRICDGMTGGLVNIRTAALLLADASASCRRRHAKCGYRCTTPAFP